MYLQRMVLDDETGFHYDAMENDIFSFAHTRKTRATIAHYFAKNEIQVKRISFIERDRSGNRMKPIDCVIIGSKEFIDGVVKEEVILKVSDEPFKTYDSNIVGWLNVTPQFDEAFVIIRSDIHDIQERVDRFFGELITAAKAELSQEEESEYIR